MELEPIFTFKRKLDIDFKLCIFCQKQNTLKPELRAATDYSRNAVDVALQERRKLRDVSSHDIIDRLENAFLKTNIQLFWHPNCYAQFTSKEKIQRIQQKEQVVQEKEHTTAAEIPSSYATRSKVKSVDWDISCFARRRNQNNAYLLL